MWDIKFGMYSEGVEAETARSKAWHILGSVINYKTIEISVRFSNLTREWVLNVFKPFWDNHASDLKPFFWAWDIDVYPDLIFYVSVTDGMKYKMPVSVLQFVDSIELEMQGIKEV